MKQLIEILSLFEENQNMVIRCTLMWLFNRQEDFLPRQSGFCRSIAEPKGNPD